MQLTQKQEEGLNITLQRYFEHEKYVVISGYAGTGKTTLVRVIVEALDIPEDKVVYASYTGKAAQVLRQMGNKNACTLHKLLYDAKPRPDGSFFFMPKESLSEEVVVIDEVSMVPQKMIEQLLRHKVFVIFMGDPGQLPPIDKDNANHLLDNPHVFLDEVMRQAKDSDIIQLSMKIRNGEPIAPFHGNDCVVIKHSDLNTGMLTWADQVICATNKSRISLNNQMRTIKGFGSEPQEGDKVICLRNYDDKWTTTGEVMVNGTVGELGSVFKTWWQPPHFLCDRPVDILSGDIVTDDGDFINIAMDYKQLTTGERFTDNRTLYKLGTYYNKKIMNDGGKSPVPIEIAYAYAITCHKAQGSQYNKVLILEERFPFDREEHKRWLYTAVTRAVEKVVLVLP